MKPSRKSVIKLSRGYFEFLISTLTLLNDSTDEQVKAFCGKPKKEAIANMVAGMQSTLDHELEAIAKAPQTAPAS